MKDTVSHFLYSDSHGVNVVGAVVGCGSVVEHFSLCGCMCICVNICVLTCMYGRIPEDKL